MASLAIFLEGTDVLSGRPTPPIWLGDSIPAADSQINADNFRRSEKRWSIKTEQRR